LNFDGLTAELLIPRGGGDGGGGWRMLQKRLNRSLAKLRRGDKRGLMMTAARIARWNKKRGWG